MWYTINHNHNTKKCRDWVYTIVKDYEGEVKKHIATKPKHKDNQLVGKTTFKHMRSWILHL